MKSPAWLSESVQNEGRVLEAGLAISTSSLRKTICSSPKSPSFTPAFPLAVQCPEKLHSWWTSSRKKVNPLALNRATATEPLARGGMLRAASLIPEPSQSNLPRLGRHLGHAARVSKRNRRQPCLECLRGRTRFGNECRQRSASSWDR